jgi:hypothetical protein
LAEKFDQGGIPPVKVLGNRVDLQPVAGGEDDAFREKGRAMSVGLTEATQRVAQGVAADGKSLP